MRLWLTALTVILWVNVSANADVVFQIEVDPDISYLSVALANSSGERLGHRDVDFSLIQNAKDCSGAPIAKRRLAEAPCARYRVRLPKTNQGRFSIEPRERVRFINPEDFLFKGRGANVQLKPGAPISHPWLRRGESSFEIVSSPRSSDPILVIGDFHSIAIPGLTKPVAFVGAAHHRDKIREWLSRVVASVSGENKFPNEDVQIIAVSVTARGDSPVPFGHVIRNQGETVRFFVDPTRTLASLHHDWTAAHELAHLKLPYLAGSGRWLSEGFASYYQNVLQARMGHYSEAEAWQRLARSFARATPIGADMSPIGATQEEFWKSRLMIYWSGAAFALLADVELRRLGLSLDAVLAQFDTPQRRSWRPRELIEALDRISGTKVFSKLYEDHASSKGMPPTEAVFAELGVSTSGDLSDTAPLATLRRQIMSAQ